ncbi:MAG: mycofactocin biosynthesis glycosyltransferase MftF [Ilumatobacteraceae bacterium]
MRYRPDGSWRRFGRVVMAGSPLRLFRLGPAGATVAERIERGDAVAPSVLIDRLLDAGAIHPVAPDPTAKRFGISDVVVVTPQLRVDESSATIGDGRITVDDGSRPPLDRATVRLDVNQGPAAARNAARPVVDTPLVAFVDADVIVPPGWLDRLLWHFDDPDVALVAPRVDGEPGSPLDLGDEPARIRAGTRVSYVPGAAMVVRTAAFDAVGGFDPTLRFGEDVDFVWRLDEAGWRCRYEPASRVWHEPRSEVAARLRQHAGYGSSAAPLALRHPSSLSPVQFNGWTAFVWSAAVTGHPLVAVAAAIGSSLALARRLPDVPTRAAVGLALRGHLSAGRQLATAVRRAWWPVVVVGALVSRRMRWIAAMSVLADVSAMPTDVAYGWGVWRGMRRHRTWAPVVPRLSAWPGKPRPT